MDKSNEIIGTSLKDTSSVPVHPKINLDEVIQNNKWTIGFLLLGLMLLGIGLFSVKSLGLFKDETKVEVLGSADVGSGKLEGGNEVGNEIVVEIAGEVGKPGVYNFTDGDRVADLVVKAGGLSGNADRDYVAKNINLAQKLVDGSKIYVPNKFEARISNIETNPKSSNSNIDTKVNINTATVAELDTLWGVGEATANKIIADRPYQKPEELLQKKIVNSSVWETIKDKVTTW